MPQNHNERRFLLQNSHKRQPNSGILLLKYEFYNCQTIKTYWPELSLPFLPLADLRESENPMYTENIIEKIIIKTGNFQIQTIIKNKL